MKTTQTEQKDDVIPTLQNCWLRVSDCEPHCNFYWSTGNTQVCMQGDVQGNTGVLVIHRHVCRVTSRVIPASVRPKSTMPGKLYAGGHKYHFYFSYLYDTMCNTRHVLAHSDVALVRDTQEPDIGGRKGCRTALTVVFPSLRIQGEVETTI